MILLISNQYNIKNNVTFIDVKNNSFLNMMYQKMSLCLAIDLFFVYLYENMFHATSVHFLENIVHTGDKFSMFYLTCITFGILVTILYIVLVLYLLAFILITQ